MTSATWVETDRIEAAMSWAMSGSGPEISPNRVKGRLEPLLEAAEQVVEEAVEAPSSWGAKPGGMILGGAVGPGVYSDSAVWLSVTSPLKHQLGPRSGIDCVDDGLLLAAMNQLVWSAGRWSGASTDGYGVVRIGCVFGLFVSGAPPPVLVVRGGGASARASVAAWAEAGGLVEPVLGRRMLDRRGPWAGSILDDAAAMRSMGPRMTIDFDAAPASEVRPDAAFSRPATIHLAATYRHGGSGSPDQSMDGSKTLDGRWLLAAQHLEAWARLIRPDLIESLPDLALTVARLRAMESMVAR